MFDTVVRSWFHRSLPPGAAMSAPAPDATAEPAPPTAAAEAPIRSAWPAGRLDLAHRLWGDGFIFPGGEIDTLRLARPLGMSAAASLLLVGVGSGGPAITIARNLGAWVTATDDDPALLASAQAQVNHAQLGKKISINSWDPDEPNFAAKGHHHCLALDPFRNAQPEPILDRLTGALKPGGQIVITSLAAPKPLDPDDRTVRRWAELERRDPAELLAPVTVTRMLGRMGLDVRVAEDTSQSHIEHALLGWRVMLRDLDRKPTRREAVPMIAEAELWLLRRRLIDDGRLRMMRWHAISRLPIV
ncbi:SAM-dependent methyltransferase [Rhodopila sp.]|uniref:SAM-dependent methyltransferase n=1 Tax=Rhodopila sp. TaxID=2480087 RepID=UPI003D0F0ABB